MDDRVKNLAIGAVLVGIAFAIYYFFIAVPPGPPVQINLDGRHWKGGENASVIIVEFSDFQCPYCSRAAGIADEVAAEFDGDVRLYYLHFPFHQNSEKAAEAAECAGDQGKFWEMHDIMFSNQGALDQEHLKSYASGLGLNMTQFNSCLGSGEKGAVIDADFDKGRAAGVTGTPTFFVNGRKLRSYDADSLRTAIRSELGR